MKLEKFVSVVLLTYEPDWDKTRRTLYSIIIQKNIGFEIIICDDGSKVNNFDKIKSYLESVDFTDYTLVENKINSGTVQNAISALPHVNGDFVKFISPGDFLYNEYALEKIFLYAKQTDSDLCCANAVYYSFENSKINIFDDMFLPKNVSPYLKQNKIEIRRSLLLCGNYLHGASFLVKKEKLRQALLFVDSKIKFSEDVAISFYFAAKKMRISFCDFASYGNGDCSSFVWYEWGTGISTSSATANTFNNLNEPKKMLELLVEHGLVSKLEWFYRYGKDGLFKKIVKLLMNPKQYIHDKFHLQYKNINRKYDIGCLEKILKN